MQMLIASHVAHTHKVRQTCMKVILATHQSTSLTSTASFSAQLNKGNTTSCITTEGNSPGLKFQAVESANTQVIKIKGEGLKKGAEKKHHHSLRNNFLVQL